MNESPPIGATIPIFDILNIAITYRDPENNSIPSANKYPIIIKSNLVISMIIPVIIKAVL